MNLLISTGLFYPAKLGGPANTIYWLAKALVRNGVGVTVVTAKDQIDADWVLSDQWQDVEGIKVRYCTSPYILKMLWHTWKEMKSSDVVMLCDMFQKQILLTAMMARMRRKRIIWSPRGELLQSALGSNRVKRYYLRAIRFLFKHYALFHATSLDEERAIKEIMGDDAKTTIIPNYIELPSQLKRQNAQPPYFLYLGRIAPIKALDRLVDGLAKSKYFRQSEYVFKMAGGVEGQFQEYFESLVKKIEDYNLQDRIIFMGPVSGQQKYQTYADADALFLVSHSENFGNVVIEALSQGTPVVASKGTPWNVLDSECAGFWIENDIEEISHSIDIMIKMQEKEKVTMREKARLLAFEFDIIHNVKNWINFLS